MSRTIRKKTVKWGWLYRRLITLPDGTIIHRYCSGTEEDVLTTRDLFWYQYLAHGESRHRNHRTPSHGYRHNRETELRAKSRQELIRWEKNPDEYEPMVNADPRSCYWDWS